MKKPRRYSELKAMNTEELKSVLITTAELCMIYGLSDLTIKGWRKGYYNTPDSKTGKYVAKWYTENHDRLQHIPQKPGLGGHNSVLYKIEWVNDFLRKTKQAYRIPAFAKHI